MSGPVLWGEPGGSEVDLVLCFGVHIEYANVGSGLPGVKCSD